MGREIKHVPLDFNWPLNKVWGGFINPFPKQSIDCPECQGKGSSAACQVLSDMWYGYAPFRPEDKGSKPWIPEDAPIKAIAERNTKTYMMVDRAVRMEAERLCEHFNKSWSHHLSQDDVNALVKADRLMDFTHTWNKKDRWVKKNPPYVPTAKEVNEWSLSGLGHDCLNQWAVVNAECKRLGLETNCKRCNGGGSLWPDPKIKRRNDRWKPTDPPKGDGIQLWETVSEGSPISPVFSKPEELASWLVSSSDYQWKENDQGTTYRQWMDFISGPGWAPSLIAVDGNVMTGVQAAV